MTNLPLLLYHYTQPFPIKTHKKKKKKVKLNKKLFAPHLIFIEDCNIYPQPPPSNRYIRRKNKKDMVMHIYIQNKNQLTELESCSKGSSICSRKTFHTES